MRRIFSIALAGLFIVNTIVGVSILSFHHFQIQEYIESMIFSERDGNNNIQLNFTADESTRLRWFEKGREFTYRGHMYDVVRTEIKKDGTINYKCIRDDKEDEIYSDLADEFNQPSPGQKTNCTLVLLLFKFLSNTFIISPSGTLADVKEIHKDRFTYFVASKPVYLSVTCEPPDLS